MPWSVDTRGRPRRARLWGKALTVTLSDSGPLAGPTAVNAISQSNGASFYREVDAARRKRIQAAGRRFVEATGGTPCLVLTGRIIGSGDAGDPTEWRVQQRCEERFGFPEPPLLEAINVILDSTGGPLDSAFKTILYLSKYTESINIYVPRKAKSASTLIAVGANSIFMSPFSELGPLDTQIRDPRNPTDYVSALDCYQSVDYVRDFGFGTLNQALKQLAFSTQGRIPLIDLVNTAAEFASTVITPMITQVKALDLGGWGRSLKIGEKYASPQDDGMPDPGVAQIQMPGNVGAAQYQAWILQRAPVAAQHCGEHLGPHRRRARGTHHHPVPIAGPAGVPGLQVEFLPQAERVPDSGLRPPQRHLPSRRRN